MKGNRMKHKEGWDGISKDDMGGYA